MDLFIVKRQIGAGRVHRNPLVELGRHLHRHVILPIAHHALANELHARRFGRTHTSSATLADDRLQIHRRIPLHATEVQVLAQRPNALLRQQRTTAAVLIHIHEAGALAHRAGQVALHVLVLEEQHVRLVATPPEAEHMRPHGADRRLVGQEDVAELGERADHAVHEGAVVVVGHAQVLRVACDVDDLRVWFI